ncbi:MAG: type II toxin-antitoxin system PemK/MazF family toxin [Myxococcota bacterium]
MGLAPAIRRGDVFLVQLEPAEGRKIRKARPCLVISPDELNQYLRTVIVAPMTTGGHAYPFRVSCRFRKRDGFVVLDQIRTVDSQRLVRKLGRVSPTALSAALGILREMFAG